MSNTDDKNSKLPTLLRNGFIVPNPKLKLTKSVIETIKKTRTIDYIINFLSERLPVTAGSAAKIPAKSLGDKVIVLKSDTGSGKSTVLPPFLYEQFQLRTRKYIAVTQPRVLTAIDISTNLPDNYSYLKLGDNLGYSTGDYKYEPKNKGIIYMTTGIILAHLKIMEPADFLKRYSFIIIDEVHDRDLNIDMAIYALKKFLADNYKDPACPFVILMSATFNPDIFMDYFDSPDENFIQVTGSTFPIEKNFLLFDTPNYIKYAIDKAEELHITNIDDIDTGSQFRDIIIFVNGKGDAKAVMEKLHFFNSTILKKPFAEVLEYINKKPKEKTGGGDSGGDDNDDEKKRYHIGVINLNRDSFNKSGTEYQNMFSKIDDIMVPVYNLTDKGVVDLNSINYWVKPTRRLIIATPIAETGVTIDTLKYCIDTGLQFSVGFNYDFGVKVITSKDVTQGMAIQRRGRVGRKAAGVWYPCFTKKTFESLDIDQFAKILIDDITQDINSILIKETQTMVVENERSNVTKKYIDENNLFLTNKISDPNYYQMTKLKQTNISSIDFLESPSANSLVYSLEKLYGLGFIDSKYNPTLLGFYANKMQKLSMENRRMIFAGYGHGANILDLITIAVFIESDRQSFMHRKYQPINMNTKKLTDKEYEFYYKIVIGDEFVEYLLIWELYSEILMTTMTKKRNKNKAYFDISKIQEWCINNKLIYEGLNTIALRRNEVIEQLISEGINPYYNGLNIDKKEYNLLDMFRNNLDVFIDEVTKIKKCIVDGYRFNILVWNNSIKKYILHHRNIPVSIRSNVISRMGDDAVQTNANFLISSGVILKKSMSNHEIFQFEHSGAISVIDAYLNLDLEFLNY